MKHSHSWRTLDLIRDHNPIAADVPKMLAGGVTAKVYELGLDVDIGGNFRESAHAARRLDAHDSRRVSRRPKAPFAAIAPRRACDDRRRPRPRQREGKVAILLGVEGESCSKGGSMS